MNPFCARGRLRAVAFVGAATVCLGAAGCSAVTSSTSSADSLSQANQAPASMGGAPEGGGSAPLTPGSGSGPVDAAARPAGSASIETATAGSPMLVRRAEAVLVVASVPAAASAIHDIATGAGGLVTQESIHSSDSKSAGEPAGVITIQVPASALDDTLARLAKVGTVASLETSSDDVKAQYVDVDSRITSMRASVERVRALLGQASALSDIISIEAELSRRQADLDALEAQMKSLKDQVALSPITIRLRTSTPEPVPTGEGFLGGLSSGWSALQASTRAVLTVLGALLPFGLALGLLAAPVIWLRRRRTAAGTPGPSAPPSPALVPAGPPAQPAPTGPASSAAHTAAPPIPEE